MDTTIPISQLKDNKNSWTIRVLLSRKKGVEQYKTSRKSGNLQKLIFTDDEGSKIQAIMFDQTIKIFEEVFHYNKSYMISKAQVRKIDSTFANVNNDIEIVIQQYTQVKEDPSHVPMRKVISNFTSFEDAKNILGFVTIVSPSLFTLKKDGTTTQMREIIIMNKEMQPIKLILWGDMAENEGQLLQQIVDQKPIIAALNVKCSEYQGEFQLSSTSTSTVQPHPDCAQVEQLEKWLKTSKRATNAGTVFKRSKMINAQEIDLHDIIHNSETLTKGVFYRFKATITNVENKDQPYYASCKTCKKGVQNIGEATNCPKCNRNVSDCIPRFKIMLEVIHGETFATIILFEEQAQALIGCRPQEYIESIKNKDQEQSKFYKKMMSYVHKECNFLVKLQRIYENNGKPSMIAHDLEEIQKEKSTNNKKKKLTKAAVEEASTESSKIASTIVQVLDDDVQVLDDNDDDDEVLNNLKRKVTISKPKKKINKMTLSKKIKIEKS